MATGSVVLLVILNALVLFSFAICFHKHVRKKKIKKNEAYYKNLREAATNHE